MSCRSVDGTADSLMQAHDSCKVVRQDIQLATARKQVENVLGPAPSLNIACLVDTVGTATIISAGDSLPTCHNSTSHVLCHSIMCHEHRSLAVHKHLKKSISKFYFFRQWN